MREFKGRTAFVTGAASGIGLGLARSFLDRGMNVMMADVEDAALKAAVHGFSNYGDRVASLRCDVSIAEELHAAAARSSRPSATCTFSATTPGCRPPARSRRSR